MVSGTIKLPYILLVIAIVISASVYDFVIIVLGFLAKIGLHGLSPGTAIWVIAAITVLVAGVPALIGLLRGLRGPR